MSVLLGGWGWLGRSPVVVGLSAVEPDRARTGTWVRLGVVASAARTDNAVEGAGAAAVVAGRREDC
ncbi:hypothetical protein [Streptomyces minutiscleroticus]|nr:hypothetical protein [Streptomyces minutiscleroticus]